LLKNVIGNIIKLLAGTNHLKEGKAIENLPELKLIWVDEGALPEKEFLPEKG
jgi:hypothetical protein